MRFGMCAAVALLAMLPAPAFADISDFLGNWTNADADNSGIARIVVTPGTGSQVNIHLFGRCGAQACDWGTQAARTYADDPGLREIRSLAADFDTGGARKHVTLHLAVGHALRFDVQTDFTDNGGHSNYATSGNVTYAGDWSMGAPVAAAPPGAAPDATVAAAPPAGSWFGSQPLVGFGPSVPEGYVPSKWEDCTPFNPGSTHAAAVDGVWRLVDFSHRLLNFGSDHAAALKAQAIVTAYHFDEECFVSRSDATMVYWKRAGQIPRSEVRGQDCVALDPAAVKAEQVGGAWTVESGGTALLDYGDDKDAAARAVSVIRTYKLAHQCFFARPSSPAQYWLSQ